MSIKFGEGSAEMIVLWQVKFLILAASKVALIGLIEVESASKPNREDK